MEDKAKWVLEKMAAQDLQLAEKVVPDTIGKAVLSLLGRGEVLTLDSLLQALAQPVESPLQRAARESAHTSLLAARRTAP